MSRESHRFGARWRRITGVVLTVAALGPTCPAASILYATSDENGGRGNQIIYTINQQTGAATALGASGLGGPIDMTSDWRPASFRLFAVDSTTNGLYLIDGVSGQSLLLGSFNPQIASIAFDATSGQLFGTSRSATQLYRIDSATAATTLVGSVGFQDVLGLGFDLSGRLFGTVSSGGGPSQLIRIDTTTGGGTLVATLPPPGVVDLAARPEDGVMFAVASGTDSIYTFDPDSGQMHLVGPYGAGVDFMNGLAFSTPEPGGAVAVFAPSVLLIVRRRRSAEAVARRRASGP
jgi:hypothetical protein